MMIRCPKCSHQQANREECEACGLLFAKYAQVRKRQKGQAKAQKEQPAKSSGTVSKIVSACVLIGLTASLTYYVVRGNTDRATMSNPTPPLVEQTTSPRATTAPTPASVTDPPAQPAMTTGNPIEYARNGTVAIETPWGKGSGFFLADTYVVTNKHVVEFDTRQRDEVRHKVETGRKLITLEQEKIAELRNRMHLQPNGPTRQQMAIILQEMEKQLARALPAQEEMEKRLHKLEQPMFGSEIRIFLADGREHSAQVSLVSSARDLALLTVYANQPTVLLPAPRNSALRQGDKVFTVGNPVGLRNTVTAGIFSGYRQHKNSTGVLLQTDAPINPGNSGGPLIDERGYVLGVNTMIIQGTEGIGFAIPIQDVFEEFGSTLHRGL